ncbi:MAG: molybdate transport system ATP-binding protein [Oleiphilaceae bacterium]|jgi:molybdate transport system ATP-binding protein
MLELVFSGSLHNTNPAKTMHTTHTFTYDFKLSLAHQGITAIYGSSGEGKTTLLRLISGLQKSPQGRLTFNNALWQDEQTFLKTENRNIGYVFQESRLFNALTVEANILYGLGGRWKKLNTETQTLVSEVCEQLGINAWLNRYPEQLSGGQQQRVALARALVCRPQLLLLDEPFSSLGEQGKLSLLHYVAHFLREHRIPCLFVSHSRFEIESLASYAVLLQQGRIIAQGDVADLVTRLDLDLSHEEQSTSLLKATVRTHDHEFALTELSLGNQSVWVQKIDATADLSVSLRVFSKDVIISTLKPVESSILNHLIGDVSEIELTQTSRVLLVVTIDEQKVLARITRKSLINLGIKIGQKVYIQFKAVSLGAISISHT